MFGFLRSPEPKRLASGESPQTRAARMLKIDQPKISRLLGGRLSGFSTERLMHF